jgi:hypothetical protein
VERLYASGLAAAVLLANVLCAAAVFFFRAGRRGSPGPTKAVRYVGFGVSGISLIYFAYLCLVGLLAPGAGAPVGR